MPVNYVHKRSEDLRFMTDQGMHPADYDGLIGNRGNAESETAIASGGVITFR